MLDKKQTLEDIESLEFISSMLEQTLKANGHNAKLSVRLSPLSDKYNNRPWNINLMRKNDYIQFLTEKDLELIQNREMTFSEFEDLSKRALNVHRKSILHNKYGDIIK